MRQILALDPGTLETGWCILSGSSVIGSGVMENNELLQWLLQRRELVGHRIAIEMIASYGMPVGREVFETCVWIGRFKQAWIDPDEVQLVYRKDVKMHLCGTAKAKDPNVWQALLDLFGGESAVGKKAAPGPLYGVKSHARAALAVAITVRDQAAGWKTPAPIATTAGEGELPF